MKLFGNVIETPRLIIYIIRVRRTMNQTNQKKKWKKTLTPIKYLIPMKCICTLQFPHSISSFCSCLACIKWKMCQIKLIQFDLTVEILKLYLNSLKWMTHNSMNSAFYDGRSLVSFHSSFFILLDLMNPFFTSVDMCACVWNQIEWNRD